MPETPRLRRLRADRRALEQLKAESSVFDFVARGEMPETYTLLFNGRGVWRPDNGSPVIPADRHEVYLRLGAAYPRMMPELTWRSPIFHPNISANGVVCLGGYGTYWVPSLALDELCTMLWDMIRFANYDPNSPYNRDAALWAKNQNDYRFPLDSRPIRNLIATKGRPSTSTREDKPQLRSPKLEIPAPVVAAAATNGNGNHHASDGITFIGGVEVIEAEVLDDNTEPEIVFID